MTILKLCELKNGFIWQWLSHPGIRILFPYSFFPAKYRFPPKRHITSTTGSDGVLFAFYSDDPSLNPDEVFSFRSVKMLKNK